eukprot:CAMPEP_0197627156 /NCGR_PEP_ID=MMETSP1338-20131121/5845_1 /TAXON_ID=43686 ORGANISM="Pelagodinium beii, Strain RCC1491" /NCGR_SAMPLE_ID=MMETSP1338 /ASSEMBLY_ACC=CAM_ASM_000754 /LENGTH=145 /DNA_ID=CAMNT_0043197797 /DNA_START=97 /DNA_END=534 /DNA_ORIENTATION=+
MSFAQGRVLLSSRDGTVHGLVGSLLALEGMLSSRVCMLSSKLPIMVTSSGENISMGLDKDGKRSPVSSATREPASVVGVISRFSASSSCNWIRAFPSSDSCSCTMLLNVGLFLSTSAGLPGRLSSCEAASARACALECMKRAGLL